MLSIIIPTHNELKYGLIEKILTLYSRLNYLEIIVSDYNSTDGTREVCKKYKVHLIESSRKSRAGRLNDGIKQASNSMIILHHPRSILTSEALEQLETRQDKLAWGAFTHKFDKDHWLLSFTSWYSNYIRGDLRSIYYLDHCLFAHKELLVSVNGFPEIDIFEDTEVCLRLKQKAKPIRLKYDATTSAIRFKVNGIIKQSYQNQILKWKYYLKRDNQQMNKSYEKGLELNNTYQEPKNRN